MVAAFTCHSGGDISRVTAQRPASVKNKEKWSRALPNARMQKRAWKGLGEEGRGRFWVGALKGLSSTESNSFVLRSLT